MHVSKSNRLRRPLIPIAAWLLLGAAGCGGSPGNGDDPTGGGGGPTGPPPGDITVAITARDAFGSPVPGAGIVLLHNSGAGYLELSTLTDADGRAEIVGGFDSVYAAILSATELEGVSHDPSRPADDRIEFDVTLHPLSGFTPGVSRLIVSGSSADGRRLEFNARLYVIEGNASTDLEDWNLGDVGVLPCAHDTGPATVDCVSTSSGFEYSYVGSTLNQSWVEPDDASDPLAISLLLDQGASLAVTDPGDRRLLGAKYFQTQLHKDDQVLLAAFAADNASTGDAALLPIQPVTIFPVADPAFTTDGSAYYSTIDSLATLEGGGSPLYAAVGEMIGFTASAAPAVSRPAVVVLASRGVSDCGSIADCGTVQDALLQQSAATGVGVVAVGLSDPSLQVDRKNLARFAQTERGAVFWALDATNVPTILGRIPEILDGRHGAVDVRIRLESPVAGAFASGNTVVGTLQIVWCPWDCTGLIDVPFALRVP
jgi:hypothetical protein